MMTRLANCRVPNVSILTAVVQNVGRRILLLLFGSVRDKRLGSFWLGLPTVGR
jgi:hypothetical protein